MVNWVRIINGLSAALRATKGLFGSKSATGGNTDINTPGRTISKKRGN